MTYTTHGYSLLSVVMERAGQQTYMAQMYALFQRMGMDSTVADDSEAIIFNRARQYRRSGPTGRLRHARPVDNSCKW